MSEPRNRIKWEWVGVAVVLLSLWGLVGVFVSAWWLNRSTGAASQTVMIEAGMTVPEIGVTLYGAGLIRSPQLLRVFARLSGSGRRMMAGPHPFHGHMTTWQILHELETPREQPVDVTIREGLRLAQTTALLSSKLRLDEQMLTQLANDSLFCRFLGVESKNLEGYLFPETYRVSADITEKRMLETMVEHFHNAFGPAFRERAKEIGMSIHEVVTLASIVEGEAQLSTERSTIAAVYHNRLKLNMRLQADPTVQYALPDGPRRLFYKDYQVDSPYNTYRHLGLPPGPISSPGKASIEAVLYPAIEAYLFFVARGDGSHVFTQTAREHELAKQETLKARKESWKKAN
ncbi:MAG: endolytic transglycosylase MltG [bacterium]|nr:endolytic transglycosylase MltG [bacterium]